VGPNGCGKSNIADAIIWALGEHNPRELRAPTSADLIFAGTERRRGLGLAQVRLTIDNSSGELAVDFTEVEVTRRVDRSGEGEYLLNRARVRRRDIQELFLTTGVGRQAYAVITQNQIDAVLSADSKARRQLIEEAAGVSRYRFRRQETLNKLENTERHLARLRDVLAEVESQLEPLVEEAEKARTYKRLSARLAELELSYLLDEFRVSYQEVIRLQGEAAALDSKRSALRKQASNLEAQEAALRERMAALEAETEGAQSGLDEARQRAQVTEGEALLARHSQAAARERRRVLSEQAQQEATALREREEQVRSLVEECASLETRLEALARELEAAERDLSQAEAQRAGLASSSTQEARALQAAQETIAVLTREQAITETALEERQRELAAAKRACEEARQHVATMVEEQRGRAERAAEAAGEAGRLAAEVERVRAAIGQAEAESEGLAREQNEGRQGLAVRRARLTLLQALQRDLEGHSEGVRAVVQAARRGEIDGRFVPLSEAIEVAPGYGRLMEAALGRMLGWVLCGTVAEARRAARLLAERGAGRATFVPVDLVGESGTPSETVALPPGFRKATEIVRAQEPFKPAVEVLVHGVAVCEHALAAEEYARANRGAVVVTTEGEVFGPWPTVSGGSLGAESVGLLTRREEIAALPAEIAQLESRLGEMGAARAALAERRQALEGELAGGLARQKEALAKSEALEAQRASGEGALAGEQSRLAEREQHERQTVEQVDQLLRRRRELAAEVEAAEDRRRHAVAGSAELEGELANLDAVYRRAAERVAGLRTEVVAFEERRNAARQRLEQAEAETEQASKAVEHNREEQRGAQETLGHWQAEEQRLAALAQEQGRAVEELQARLRTLREERGQALISAEGVRERLRGLMREQAGLGAELEEVRASLGRALSKRDSIQDRLAQEFALSANEALSNAQAAGDLENREAVGREVRSLRAQIRALGEVNIGAIGHFDRLTQRRIFLQEQILDLEEGAEGLRRAIDEIDQRTRMQFAETFERVRVEFDNMFRRMFQGGAAELLLTDPKNPLESGVEVSVRLPGKEHKNLLALSGGEKALTALALVGALLKVKPPPFCILDEVDAPLDDANVGRFCEMLGDLAKHTQFLVITHNKITMQEADYVYGVTMREPGVSAVYSLRVAEYAAN
jgi:chromosome segregation protein